MQGSGLLLSSALLLAALVSAPAQSVPAPQNQPEPSSVSVYDPREALATALHKLNEANQDVRRFTYTLDLSMTNTNSSGHTSALHTVQYEAINLNGHPYMRLLQKDGAPLSGPDLKAEQKRYDKAIRKKKDLGISKRADMDGFGLVESDVSANAALGPGYTLELKDSEVLDDEAVHLIVATPVPDIHHMSTCLWNLRFWIADSTGNIRRYRADTEGDTRPVCDKSYEDVKFVEIDGIPKTSTQVSRFNLPDIDGSFYSSRSVARYTNYRRFGATVTIHPGVVIPSGAPQAP